MKNKIILIMSSILVILTIVPIVNSFGVSAPYWTMEPARPLTLHPGETTTVNINLQNMVDPEDVTVKAELTSGSEITSLKEETYVVKAGTHDTMVPLKIKIPRDAQVGNTTRIHVKFKTVAAHGTGMVTMGVGMGISFDVIVVGEPVELSPLEKIPWTPIAIIFGIIILGIIITTIIRRRKKLIQGQKELVEKNKTNKF